MTKHNAVSWTGSWTRKKKWIDERKRYNLNELCSLVNTNSISFDNCPMITQNVNISIKMDEWYLGIISNIFTILLKF